VLWQQSFLNGYAPAANQDFVVVPESESIAVLAADTGRTLWKAALPGDAGTSPALDGRRIYVGCLKAKALCTIDIETRRQQTFAVSGEIGTSIALSGGLAYFVTDTGWLYAVR
jgi:outer membrane protein assembly factor BamB